MLQIADLESSSSMLEDLSDLETRAIKGGQHPAEPGGARVKPKRRRYCYEGTGGSDNRQVPCPPPEPPPGILS